MRELTEVNLPSKLKVISNGLFSFCSSLPSVVIPESVVEIGSSAFESCVSLTSLSVPESVSKIGDHFVFNNTSLTDLYIHRATPAELGALYGEFLQDVTLHVPAGSLDAYKTATQWEKFAHISDDIQTSGIIPLVTDSAADVIYDLQGKRIKALQPGVNIIKKKDGTTIKKIIK